LYPYLYKLQEADAYARDPAYLQISLDELAEIRERYDRVVGEKQCVKLSQLAVTGRDLMEIGYTSGREMGQILNLLLEQVLDRPEYNQREILLQAAAKLRNNTGDINE
jgi:tRNA nucleotidyltransferase (CCA-adding enzyme)